MLFGNWFHSSIHNELGENKNRFVRAVKDRILREISSLDEVKGVGSQMVSPKGELL